jgi:hypothetical protein
MSRSLLRDLLLVHLPAAALVGLLWWQLAPRLPYTVVQGTGYLLDEVATGRAVAGDGTFAVLAAAAGVLCATVMLLLDHQGPALPLNLTVAGLLGAGGAWLLGTWLGPGPLADLVAAAPDRSVVVSGPELSAPGVLLLWPMLAVAVVLATTWISAPERPREPAPPP